MKPLENLDAVAGPVGGNRFPGALIELLASTRDRRSAECLHAWRDFDDLKTISSAARALAHGVARMYIEGHLEEWHIPAGHAEDAFKAAFDLSAYGVARAN